MLENQTIHDYREHLNLMRSRLNFIPSYLHAAALKEIQKSEDDYLKEYVKPLSSDDKQTLSEISEIWSR